MATLQTLRNKGSLLIAFIGIALFAFIAGDIVKLFQKAPEEPTVGVINGEGIKVSEFYAFRNECEQAYNLTRGGVSLSESDQETITQLAWESLANYRTATAQAQAAGINFTNEELTYILNTNWGGIASQYTASLPAEFRTANGAFNLEFVNMIIDEYNKYAQEGAMPEELKNLHDAWKFIEKEITCEVINRKLAQLYAFASTVPNEAVAKSNFELNNNTYNVEIAAYPYTGFTGEVPAISEEEMKAYYEANKSNRFQQPVDLFDIVYINHEIKPTDSDMMPLRAELEKYATMLQSKDADINEIAIYSSTERPYDGFLWTIDARSIDATGQRYESKFKEGHKFSIQQGETGKAEAPFIDKSDNTYNLVMNVRKETVPDTIKLRAIAIQSQSAEELNATADSILNALNNKVDFNKVAENYTADTIEFKTRDFINCIGFIPTPEAQNKVYTAKINAYDVIEFGPNAKLIYQVLEKKGKVEAYDPIIIERRIPTSIDTYNVEYNKLSQVVTNSKSIEELEKNALTGNYRLETQNSLNANSVNIAGITGTRDILRWAVDGSRKAGDISNIQEYSIGNKKYLLVAAIKEVAPKGYAGYDKVSSFINNTLTNDKKAELMTAEMKGKSIEQLKENQNIKFSNTDQVEYKKATSVQSTNNDELVISAAVAKMNAGETSAPIKGDYGVYVVKVLSKEAKNGTFNADEEAAYIQSLDYYNNPNVINQLLQNAASEVYKTENQVFKHL